LQCRWSSSCCACQVYSILGTLVCEL